MTIWDLVSPLLRLFLFFLGDRILAKWLGKLNWYIEQSLTPEMRKQVKEEYLRMNADIESGLNQKPKPKP